MFRHPLPPSRPLPVNFKPAKQEAGVAICDALLDYYLPNQVQRERAHRDLMARDGIKESRLGLYKFNPTPQNDTAVAAAVADGGGRSPTGGDNNNGERDEDTASSGGGGMAGNGREEQDEEGRDVDDDVSFQDEIYTNTSYERLLMVHFRKRILMSFDPSLLGAPA